MLSIRPAATTFSFKVMRPFQLDVCFRVSESQFRNDELLSLMANERLKIDVKGGWNLVLDFQQSRKTRPAFLSLYNFFRSSAKLA